LLAFYAVTEREYIRLYDRITAMSRDLMLPTPPQLSPERFHRIWSHIAAGEEKAKDFDSLMAAATRAKRRLLAYIEEEGPFVFEDGRCLFIDVAAFELDHWQWMRILKPRELPTSGGDMSSVGILQTRPEACGTGFFITEDGYLITNQHVAGNGAQVRLVTEAGLISAKVVKVDAANDLALLKVEGKFTPIPVVSSRAVKMGGTVATVGFPNIGLQGFAPKLAKGEIAALSGPQDDPRYFQISVPVQPGNSGGALVDERGNVVGVVAAKLNVAAAVATSGALPANVNYAVKSSLLLSFLESVPDVSAKLKEPNTKERKFEDVVKSAEQAAVLVLVC